LGFRLRLEIENPLHLEYTFFAAAANNAWLKCEQYYKRADETAAYYAAEVLQPSRKWSWLHQEWADDTVKGPWLAVAKTPSNSFGKKNTKGSLVGRNQVLHWFLGRGTRTTNLALFQSIGESRPPNR